MGRPRRRSPPLLYGIKASSRVAGKDIQGNSPGWLSNSMLLPGHSIVGDIGHVAGIDSGTAAFHPL